MNPPLEIKRGAPARGRKERAKEDTRGAKKGADGSNDYSREQGKWGALPDEASKGSADNRLDANLLQRRP
jgi:hypothetical protein